MSRDMLTDKSSMRVSNSEGWIFLDIKQDQLQGIKETSSAIEQRRNSILTYIGELHNNYRNMLSINLGSNKIFGAIEFANETFKENQRQFNAISKLFKGVNSKRIFLMRMIKNSVNKLNEESGQHFEVYQRKQHDVSGLTNMEIKTLYARIIDQEFKIKEINYTQKDLADEVERRSGIKCHQSDISKIAHIKSKPIERMLLKTSKDNHIPMLKKGWDRKIGFIYSYN